MSDESRSNTYSLAKAMLNETLERKVVGIVLRAAACQWVLCGLGRLSGLATCGRWSLSKRACCLRGLCTCADGVRVNVIYAEGPNVIKVTVAVASVALPCVNVKPYMHGIALMEVKLLQTVSTEHRESTSPGVGVLGLNDEFLQLPGIVRTSRNTLTRGILFNDDSFYFNSL